MKLVPIAKKILKDISNGEISSALSKLGVKSIFQLKKNSFNKEWKNIQNNKSDYETQYQFFQNLNSFVFGLKERDLLYWIKRALFGLFVIVATFFINKLLQKTDVEKCDIEDDCTIVISTFTGNPDSAIPQLIYEVLEEENSYYSAQVCPVKTEGALSEEYFKTDYLKTLKKKPQVIIYGHYSDGQNLTVNIVSPPSLISEQIKSNTLQNDFKISDNTPKEIKEGLVNSGMLAAILSSFSDYDKCSATSDAIQSSIQNQIDMIEDSNTKALLYAYEAESEYANDEIDSSLEAMNKSLEYNSEDITNYARRGRIRDTLNDYSGAFEDYSTFIEEFDSSGNPVVTNHTVRTNRRVMISDAYEEKGEKIFKEDGLCKEKYLKSLNDDIEFYKTTKLEGIDNELMISRTKATIERLQPETPPVEGDAVITGSVRDVNNNGLANVVVQVNENNNFARTDEEGNFKIAIDEMSENLKFSKEGYLTQAVPINNRTAITINLIEDEEITPITETETSMLSGVVYDDRERPLPGATVLLEKTNRVTLSDYKGEFSIKSEESTGRIKANLEGYKAQSRNFSDAEPIYFFLKKEKAESYYMKGRVISSSGDELANAWVGIPNTKYETTTDSNGQFYIEAKEPMKQLIAQHKSHLKKTIDVGESNYVEIVLQEEKPHATITGIIYGENQNLLSGAQIYLVGTEEQTTSDKYGKFSIDLTEPAKELVVRMKAYEAQRVEIGDKKFITVSMKASNTEKHITIKSSLGNDYSDVSLNARMFRLNSLEEYKEFKYQLEKELANRSRVDFSTRVSRLSRALKKYSAVYDFSRKGNLLVSNDKFELNEIFVDEYHYLIVFVENNETKLYNGKSLIKSSNFTGNFGVLQ